MSLPAGGVFTVIEGSKAGSKSDAFRSASSFFTASAVVSAGTSPEADANAPAAVP